MKNNLPWFSHYNSTHNEPEMQALLAEYGFEGYGRFWVLCEKIAASPDVFLDISSRVIKLTVARTLGLSAEDFDGFIGFLSAPDIGLIKLENGIISSDQLQKDYKQVATKRKTERDNYNKNNPTTESPIPSTETPFPTAENIHNTIHNNTGDKSTEDNNTETYKNLSDRFIRIWKGNSDVFNFTAKIKNRQDWETFWKTCTFSENEIAARLENYISGVKSGVIERRFVPASPDTFVLNGWLQKSAEPYKKPGQHITNDEVENYKQYFREDLNETNEAKVIDF